MDEWRGRALSALDELAASGREFTSDDLLAAVGFPDGEHLPNARNNVIGSVFRSASKRRIIHPVGVARSQVPTRKGGMVRVWQGVR